jgi:hypothetical protein
VVTLAALLVFFAGLLGFTVGHIMGYTSGSRRRHHIP